MRLDQSQLSGELSVRNFDRPAIDFELSLDQIEMDRYLEPVTDTATEGLPLGETNIELPVDMLEGLNITGQFTIGSVVSAGMTFTDMVAGLTVKNKRLRLHPMSALFYGGTYSGDISKFDCFYVAFFIYSRNIFIIYFQHCFQYFLYRA